MFMGWPISVAFFSAAAIILLASSNVTIKSSFGIKVMAKSKSVF